MSFCKFSSGYINASSVNLENKFINDFVPIAPGDYVKVYLLGLLKCQNSGGVDNTIENFRNVLGFSEQQILDAFNFWQEQNLVQILDTNPIEIRYLSVKDSLKDIKKIENKKYASFTEELQEIISGRQITPNEFLKYIDFVEENGFQPCDFCMIVKYCVQKKGDNINCNYILTVAKVWADEGVKTAEKIEEKIESLAFFASDINQIAKTLKFKGNLSIEHQQMYEKWIKKMGFNLNTILLLAKKIAPKTKSFGFESLDKLLVKYYELKLFSYAEIEEYEGNKTNLINIAYEVNKALGVFYESVENEVETYLIPWIQKGFNEQSLIQIANFCFKTNIRTLEGMDSSIQKFYKIGLTSVSSIDNHLNEIIETDKKIKGYLSKLNIDRRVNNFDRALYRNWTYTYKFSEDIINYALELSIAKNNAMQYANSLLTDWNNKKLKTLQEVKNQPNVTTLPSSNFERKSFVSRSYSEEELNALFDNLAELNP